MTVKFGCRICKGKNRKLQIILTKNLLTFIHNRGNIKRIIKNQNIWL